MSPAAALSIKSIPLTEKLYDTIKEQRNFNCNNPTVNDFFFDDTWAMQKLYYIQTTLVFADSRLAAFYSVASDSLQVQPPEGEEVDSFKKRFKFFPALKVQWIGVDSASQGNGIGTVLMKNIVSKAYLLNDTHNTGCRFVTLDAQYDFRQPSNRALNPYAFYERFGFRFCDQGTATGRFNKFKSAKEAYESNRRGINLHGTVSLYFDIFKLPQIL